MKKAIIISLIITSFVGCNSIRNMTVKQFECTPQTFQYDSSYKENNSRQYFIHDEFAYQSAEKYTVESLKENYLGFLKLEKTPTRNIHDTTIVDTIYEFQNKQDTIAFYRAKHKDLLKKFDVTSSKFPLYGCVATGQSKDSLKRQFGIKTHIGDTILIGDEEKSSVFTFFFEKNKIKRIVNTPYFD